MKDGNPKVVVVMPAYNAARTLRMTYADLPHDAVDLVIPRPTKPTRIK